MGDLAGIQPPSMNWDTDDLPAAFRRFKQYCELIFSGPLSERGENQKVSYLLLCVGQSGLEIYNTRSFDKPENADKLTVIWSKFTKYVEPKSNPRLARYSLQNLRQLSNETVDDFMTRCKTQASKYEFRDNTEKEERLIEQLIIGTNSRNIQEN